MYNKLLFKCGKKRNQQIFLVKLKINALMNFAYCSANLRDISWHFQGYIMNKIFEILLGLSQPAKDEISFCEMNRWIYTESSSITFISFWNGMQKDWFEKNWILEVGGTGARSTTEMAVLQRCEDASKNDQGWLVSDWRWISGIFEVGLTDTHTDGQTLL